MKAESVRFGWFSVHTYMEVGFAYLLSMKYDNSNVDVKDKYGTKFFWMNFKKYFLTIFILYLETQKGAAQITAKFDQM